MQAMAMNAVSALPISSAPEVSRVALADLKVDRCFRESGVSKEHVELLVELDGRWPPVLVRRADQLVVDGIHRVTAARLLGLRWIEVEWFDGDPDDALLEFVRRNASHGLPLTLRERKRVASRLLCTHPDWSDRRLAGLCAISPKTVATLRTMAGGRPNGQSPHSDSESRVGRDDRARPVNRAAMRLRVVEAIKAQPDASLRSVAAVAGVSPETVRLVRMSMPRGARRRVVARRGDAHAGPGDCRAAGLEGRRRARCRVTRATSSPGSTRRRSPSRSVRRGPRRFPSGGCTRSPTRPVAGPSCG